MSIGEIVLIYVLLCFCTVGAIFTADSVEALAARVLWRAAVFILLILNFSVHMNSYLQCNTLAEVLVKNNVAFPEGYSSLEKDIRKKLAIAQVEKDFNQKETK